MADKTAIAIGQTAVTVLTSGTIAANTVTIVFDEATEIGELAAQYERVKRAIIEYGS